MGIETNFYEIMEIAISNPKKSVELASKLIEELRAEREEYEKEKQEILEELEELIRR